METIKVEAKGNNGINGSRKFNTMKEAQDYVAKIVKLGWKAEIINDSAKSDEQSEHENFRAY